MANHCIKARFCLWTTFKKKKIIDFYINDYLRISTSYAVTDERWVGKRQIFNNSIGFLSIPIIIGRAHPAPKVCARLRSYAIP